MKCTCEMITVVATIRPILTLVHPFPVIISIPKAIVKYILIVPVLYGDLCRIIVQHLVRRGRVGTERSKVNKSHHVLTPRKESRNEVQ